MRASNATVTRLAIIAGAIGIVIGAVLVGAVATQRLRHRASTGDCREVRPRGELAPEAAALRYRYAAVVTADASAEARSTITALEARVQAMPSSPFDHAELAELYFRRAQLDGDPDGYRAAEAMARRSLALLPAPNPAVLTLAKLADLRHDFRDAIALAQQHQGRSAHAKLLIATSHLALGELVTAGQAAQAALDIKPDSAGYLTRALIMQAQGRDAEAAYDFASAARVDEPGDRPAAARLRTLWARFLLRRGELTGAAMALDEALRIVPGFALATAQRGELALRTGHARQAAQHFEQAFIASRQVRYLIDQARADELAGHAAAADALRDQVEAIVRAELGEGGTGHRLDLAEVLIDRGRPADLAEAVGLARDEVARRGSVEARVQLARALARTGARDEAIHEVQAALASGAREAQLYELAAQLEAQRGNAAGAALYRGQADRLDPGASGWRRLGLEPRR